MNDMTPPPAPAAVSASDAAMIHAGPDHTSTSWPELLVLLTREIEPNDIIEQMWVRDIAVLTGRINQLRAIHAGLHRHVIYSLAREKPACPTGGDAPQSELPERDWARNEDERDSLRDVVECMGRFDLVDLGQCGEAFERLVGFSYATRFEALTSLDGLLKELLAERDSVFSKLEGRRRQKASEASRQVEITALTSCASTDAAGCPDDADD
ncbi:hypothetical protein GCM10011371_34820 [Novosphingobium marinum]|uniref:Uncharacterized protein n=1 Tax=Novosphingobium marinum TaxID=1514948 RepID=A0A7Y9Y1E1_9SPHN|nr:hypothetical protein [Novosphingobium marinum]NYH97185.1 hypothetical protein [Novosphingobium marinum]GGC44429.1 hypothetical protein GCM10011371_34820 [Novosphingobium marinum]